jgi:hypothetical protein
MKTANNLVGKRFEKLIVIERKSSDRNGHIFWLCRCDCGKETTVRGLHLTRSKGNVKSCGCLRNVKGVDHRDWKGCGDISGNYWATHILRNKKRNTKRSALPINITIEYAWDLFLKQDKKCALSGLYLSFPTKWHDRSGTASLDRIDSSLGYIKGNVQWVHKDVNMMKRTYSQEYFTNICKLIANYTE